MDEIMKSIKFGWRGGDITRQCIQTNVGMKKLNFDEDDKNMQFQLNTK